MNGHYNMQNTSGNNNNDNNRKTVIVIESDISYVIFIFVGYLNSFIAFIPI